MNRAELALMRCSVAPRGLPAPAVTRLIKELAGVMALPEVRDNYEQVGRTVNTGIPEAITAAIRQDVPRWRKIVREAQISENR